MGTFAHWICISLQPIYDWSKKKNIETIKTSSHGLCRIKSGSLQQILLSWLFYVDIFHNRLDGRPLKCLHIYINYTFGFGKKREKNWRQKNASEKCVGDREWASSWPPNVLVKGGKIFSLSSTIGENTKTFLQNKNILGFFVVVVVTIIGQCHYSADELNCFKEYKADRQKNTV
jgi:hypothetical protein